MGHDSAAEILSDLHLLRRFAVLTFLDIIGSDELSLRLRLKLQCQKSHPTTKPS